jgi:hypothetical protein
MAMSADVPAHPALASSDAVVDWCVRNALRRESKGEPGQAGVWAYVGALTASECGHSWLCAEPLEALLGRLALLLPRAAHAPSTPPRRPPRRWLHVLSITTPIGGHTALARRWIAHAPAGERHDVLLTAQSAEAMAPALAAAARGRGGMVRTLTGAGGLMARAAALRDIAREHADAVVLHIHPWDVLPALAFGAPGGPPVLAMNHADHAFWVGCAAADAVIDFRDSGLALTGALRGARGSRMLPVPLDTRDALPFDRAPLAGRVGAPDALARRHVLLTIGRSAKYRDHPALDFAPAIERVVTTLGDCTLIAVGPAADDPRWQRLAERTSGRIVAVGEQAELAPWHAAADLYLEGFPIGSYIALLEAMQAGRAFVRKPWLAPPEVLPPDAGALAAFPPPCDPDAWVAQAVDLARDVDRRAQRAHDARAAVQAVHVGAGWQAQLARLQDSVPLEHGSGLRTAPSPLPAALAAYVAGLHAPGAQPTPLEVAQQAAARQGLQTRTDVVLVDALRAARR